MNKKKATDLEQYRAAVDKKVVDSNESLKEMEGHKEELNNAVKETANKAEKLDLWKKTDEAKKKVEKVEKSKEWKVQKEKMIEEMSRLESLLSEMIKFSSLKEGRGITFLYFNNFKRFFVSIPLE